MGKTKLTIRLPDHIIEDVIGDADNKTDRIRQLLHKADKYEMMEAMADRDAMQAFISSMKTEAENKKDYGPTGPCIYVFGSPLRFSSHFEKTNPGTAVSPTSANIPS